MKSVAFIFSVVFYSLSSHAWEAGTYRCSDFEYKISSVSVNGGANVPHFVVQSPEGTTSGFPVLSVRDSVESLTLWTGSSGYRIVFENGRVEGACVKTK